MNGGAEQRNDNLVLLPAALRTTCPLVVLPDTKSTTSSLANTTKVEVIKKNQEESMKKPLVQQAEADAAAGGIVVAAAAKKKQGNDDDDDANQKRPLSRREKREKLNAKHAAPQFPRIQNPTQRAKAYIRAAGLTANTKNSNDRLEDSTAAEIHLGRKLGAPDERTRHQTVLQLQQYLKARSTNGKGLTELDLLKLCKCLWYCLYMADRVPVQSELSKHMVGLIWSVAGTVEEDEYAAAMYLQLCGGDDDDEGFEDYNDNNQDSDDEDVTMEELENTLNEMDDNSDEEGDNEDEPHGDESDEETSSTSSDLQAKQAVLLEEQQQDDADSEDDDDDDDRNVGHCRGAHLASLFVRCWLRTIVREWTRMDKYRIDKFYTLLRELVHVVYKYMAQRHWNLGMIRLFNDAIFEEVLSQTPNGVRYHLIDVCVEELAKVAQLKDTPVVTEAVFLEVMEPFFALAQTGGGGADTGGDDTVHRRVVEHVLEKFLFRYSVFREKSDGDVGGNTKNPLLDQVHVGTVANFIFEVAADEAILSASYRKNLYDTYKKYAKRMKVVGEDKDVDIEGIESEDDDYDDDDDDDDDDCDEEDCHNPHLHLHHHHSSDKEMKEDDDQPDDGEALADKDTEAPIVEQLSKQAKKNFKATAAPEQEPELATEPLKRKKKKKKDRKKRLLQDNVGGGSKESIDEVSSAEEEITISYAEQKAAKKKLQAPTQQEDQNKPSKQGKNKKRNHRGETEEEAMERKRVKFGSKNVARSWKASMKALRTMDSPVTGAKPEEGILRNKKQGKKQQSKSTSLKKTSRKKATDYF